MAVASTISELRTLINHVSLGDQQQGDLLPTGLTDIDAAIGGGLLGGALHEWFGVLPHPESRVVVRKWTPPICILVHLLWQTFESCEQPRWTVWIGTRCFPYPSVLVRGTEMDSRLLERSLFIGVHSTKNRLLAADLTIRSPSVGAVVVDGSSFAMPETRRIQLNAKKHRTLVLMVRPASEQGELSAAQTRWRVRWEPNVSTTDRVFLNPRWSVELLRCKGVLSENARNVWALEWDCDTSTLNLPSQVVRPARSPQEQQAQSPLQDITRRA